MDLSWIFASLLAIVLAFSISALRRRVYRLEDVVLRLKDQVAGLSATPATTAPSAATSDAPAEAPAAPEAAPAPVIDIEPFVD